MRTIFSRPALFAIALAAFVSEASAQQAIRAHIDYLRPLRINANYAALQCEPESAYYKWAAVELPYSEPRSWACGGVTYTDMVQVTDAGDLFPGECVSFVKAVSGTDHVTAFYRENGPHWYAGPSVIAANGNVVSSISPGAAIATFDSNGLYDGGHAVIVLRRVDDNTIEVADQNFITGAYDAMVVGKHLLTITGSGTVSDLSEYRFIVW